MSKDKTLKHENTSEGCGDDVSDDRTTWYTRPMPDVSRGAGMRTLRIYNNIAQAIALGETRDTINGKNVSTIRDIRNTIGHYYERVIVYHTDINIYDIKAIARGWRCDTACVYYIHDINRRMSAIVDDMRVL